jgi:transposase InsO family protein
VAVGLHPLHLADRTDVEVLTWLDDHSRYLLSATVHQPVAADDVVAVFLGLIEEYGPPASTLTDNGSVYTSRFTGGRNAFEYVLPLLGIQQKNGSPGHPQTQGKTERFHQTHQRWLRARPAARSLAELQRQLDEFREHYNEQRPHRALQRRTPGDAYRATPKAVPASNGHAPGHYRLRYDRLDTTGKMSFRRAGRMHHLGDRPRARPQTRPRVRRRPSRHSRRAGHRRDPLHSPDPADQDLLAQPKQSARPLAELPQL